MPAFDYTNRDYDTIKTNLLSRAAVVMPEWTDRDPSDFGMLLVDLWAYAADILHYYVDRAAGEAFLSTATQRESVLALANLFDYIPSSRSSAQGTLSLANTETADYTVAPYTRFIARYDDITYQIYTLSGGLVSGSGTGDIDIREGELFLDESLTSSSSGLGAQRYTLANNGAVISSIVVNVYEDGVNPTAYQRVPRITSADTGERVFATDVNADGDVELVFGTNLNGFIPPSGSPITSTYVVSSGYDGNLPANSVTGFYSSTPTGISTTTSTALSGGVDEESITTLKRSIPSVISAQNRAVTKSDFISLTNQIEGISKTTVQYIPQGGSPTNASVFVYPQPARADYLTTVDTSQAISADIQTTVEETLQPKALLGVDVHCMETITWDTVDVTAEVFVNAKHVSNWVGVDVDAAIDELFEFDNVFFGQRLTLGQLYRIVLNVSGVDYIDITVFDNDGAALETSILIDEFQLPKKGSVNITMTGGITTS